MALDIRSYDVSAGAACSSGSVKFSPVVKAMGFSEEEASSTLRFSFGMNNTQEQIEVLVPVLKDVYELQL